MPWLGLSSLRHLRWLRWGSGGILAPQVPRCSGALARDPSSLAPHVAQVATEASQQGTCRCSGALLELEVSNREPAHLQVAPALKRLFSHGILLNISEMFKHTVNCFFAVES